MMSRAPHRRRSRRSLRHLMGSTAPGLPLLCHRSSVPGSSRVPSIPARLMPTRPLPCSRARRPRRPDSCSAPLHAPAGAPGNLALHSALTPLLLQCPHARALSPRPESTVFRSQAQPGCLPRCSLASQIQSSLLAPRGQPDSARPYPSITRSAQAARASGSHRHQPLRWPEGPTGAVGQACVVFVEGACSRVEQMEGG